MVVPLMFCVFVNTWCPDLLDILIFTPFLLRDGSMPRLAFFMFCTGSHISVNQAGMPLVKALSLTITTVVIGAVVGVLVTYFFGPAVVLGVVPMSIVACMTNSNSGLYAALSGAFGDSTYVGALSVLSSNYGPFFTMLAFGLTGLAYIPFLILFGTILRIIIGCVLGNRGHRSARLAEACRVHLHPFIRLSTRHRPEPAP
ncbi:2-keto-3-deoxygluconate permease, partial [Oceanidesulfovibrio marinus]